MNSRLYILFGLIAALLSATAASAQSTPSANTIFKKLNRQAAPSSVKRRVSVRELVRNRRLRRTLPSVDINSINFKFGSANIPLSQRWKVRTIADALLRFRRRDERFLVEGHTDAVGSRRVNQRLSDRRAASLKRALVQWFGVSPRILITAGYGEDFLLINTQREDWRNRRVVLRRVTGVLR